MTFVLDENVSPRLAQILDIYDQQNEIRHLLEAFPAGTPDLEWLMSIGHWAPKPTVLGGDARILKNAAERAALREAG